MTDTLPTVVIPFVPGAASPVRIVQAAKDLAQIRFLVPRGTSGELLEVLRQLAPCAEAESDGDRFVVPAELRDLSLAAVVTFAEQLLAPTAFLAEELSLPNNAAAVRAGALRKSGQRKLLAAAGVDRTKAAAVRDPAALVAAVDFVGTPCVVKPDGGSGSTRTYLVSGPEDLEQLGRELTAAVEAGPMVVEELLCGRTSGPWGDYVSVETVSAGGVHRVLGITGKLPLAPPFRERGHVFPATVDDDLAQACESLAVRALTAIGLREGPAHLELKLTGTGPRIIEVNSRLGGYVDEVWAAAGVVSPVRTVLAAALGRPGALDPPQPSSVGWYWASHAPMEARRLLELDGLKEARRLEDVRYVGRNRRPGESVDWRNGWADHLALVFGSSPDHEAALATIDRLEQLVTGTFEFGG